MNDQEKREVAHLNEGMAAMREWALDSFDKIYEDFKFFSTTPDADGERKVDADAPLDPALLTPAAILAGFCLLAHVIEESKQ